MKTSISFRISIIFCLSVFFNFPIINAQNKSVDIIDQYQNYASSPREVVYVHLNKSTYIKGESIGFTAYVFNKEDKKPSKTTTNLYIILEDKNKKKQQLLKVENGIASNVIDLDSSFTSGHYTFKAYTNWMRNFNEQNYFIESIRVINPNNEEFIKTASYNESSIDAQFLPEGGHLLNNVVNNIGVVLKDKNGYGIPNAQGSVRDKNDVLIAEFKVNHLGIGKFLLLAELGNTYKVKVNTLNQEFSFNLSEKIEPIGITLSLVSHKNKAIVSIITNNESLKYLKEKKLKLTLHNGDKIDAVNIAFNDETTIIKVFELKNMPTGVNIFTLFNENNKPIVERLFFNYNGLDIHKSNNVSTVKNGDSINVDLNFKHINTQVFNNISVSVLPEETNSYERHHNMLSYMFLQPYISNTIEQAKYYFININETKKLELDNLLMTQGWSSYNWDRIFSSSLPFYEFENGIKVTANINNKIKDASETYMIHAAKNQEPVLFTLSEYDKSFSIENTFPSDNDKILISKVVNGNKLKPARVYLQSFPSKIPEFNSSYNTLNPKSYFTYSTKYNNPIIENTKGVENLSEVVVTGYLKNKRIRAQKLTKSTWGKIHVFDDNDRQLFNTLTQYINSRTSFRAFDDLTTGTLVAQNPIASTQNTGSNPFFFLDDMPLYNTNILFRYPMFNVDYIEINNSGVGEGIRGGSGVIKIYTRKDLDYKTNNQSVQTYKLPLSFSKDKRFYTPKYKYYNDDFYKSYGTIDWKPNLKIDEQGIVSFKIAKPEVPVRLFIEGITKNGQFISENINL